MDFAREEKTLRNMEVIVVGALGTVLKGLEKRLWELNIRGKSKPSSYSTGKIS